MGKQTWHNPSRSRPPPAMAVFPPNPPPRNFPQTYTYTYRCHVVYFDAPRLQSFCKKRRSARLNDSFLASVAERGVETLPGWLRPVVGWLLRRPRGSRWRRGDNSRAGRSVDSKRWQSNGFGPWLQSTWPRSGDCSGRSASSDGRGRGSSPPLIPPRLGSVAKRDQQRKWLAPQLSLLQLAPETIGDLMEVAL